MTIAEVTETIVGWAQSCNTAEQLGLCEQASEVFIRQRFQSVESPFVLSFALNEVASTIIDRRTRIKSKQTIEEPIS